jgi:hypothetical protein
MEFLRRSHEMTIDTFVAMIPRMWAAVTTVVYIFIIIRKPNSQILYLAHIVIILPVFQGFGFFVTVLGIDNGPMTSASAARIFIFGGLESQPPPSPQPRHSHSHLTSSPLSIYSTISMV